MSLIPKSGTDKLPAKQIRRNVHVLDNTNIEEFFRQPSPDELKVTSEMRVLEIIDDLMSQTSEELENWSQGQDVTYAPLPPLKAMKSSDSSHIDGYHGGHMVSSPIALTSPLAESNLTSVSRAQIARRTSQSTSHTQSTKQTEERKMQHSAEEKNSLPFSNKPSFQSFLKRVGKTPPPTSVKDFTYPPESIPALSKQVSGWFEIDSSDGYDDDEICVRLSRSATPPPPPKFATQRNLYKRERLGVRDVEPKKVRSRPRSNSLPVFTVKRKPLPKDSPLFAPKNSTMKRTATFDDIVFDNPVDMSGIKSRNQSESEADRFEHSLALPPIFMSTLSRGKSIRRKLKGQVHIPHRI